MRIHMMVQYSGDWWEARRGKVTASNADRILTPTGKPSAQQDDYAAELVGEQFVFDPNFLTEKPMSTAMRHGRDTEPEARDWYAADRKARVQMVGGVQSECGRWWASPDGLIRDDKTWLGGLELKCPIPKTHVKYLIANALPPEYRPQVHFQLLVTKLPFVEFVSYCRGMRALVVRVHPDAFTERLAAELEAFDRKYRAALAAVTEGVAATPGGDSR